VHRFRQDQFARAMSDWSPSQRAIFADLLTRFVAALDAPDPDRDPPDGSSR
jgi:hypothetical protein